nr:zinc finger, CCHC-type [Tanacetum cinerariifolium]GEX02777.1 zinc finger, CCHC-type [Tanacetum cinerariifolium]
MIFTIGILRFPQLGRFTQHKMNMDEAIQVSCIIDKLPHSWKDFKHTLKHLKEELTLVELGSHLRIEESLKMQDSDKLKGNNVVGPSVVNMVEHNNSSRMVMLHGGLTQEQLFMYVKIDDALTSQRNDSILWRTRLGYVHFKRMQDMSKDGLIPAFDVNIKNCERSIECIFVRYAEHSKAFRFYVIEPNDSVSINSIIESRYAIFNENRFSSVPRPSLRIPNGTKDIGGSVVPKEVTKKVVQQPEPEIRKSKRNRTPKNIGLEFQLYLIKGTMDEVFDQHSYCFNVEDDQEPLDEARLVIQGFKQKSGINYFDTYAPVERISTIRLMIVMASIHNMVIHQMDVKTAFLNGDLDEEVYMN